MRALTLHQPWASLIAIGLKTVETRSWPAPKSLIGQRIAIHAAKRYPVPFENDTIGDFHFTEDIPLGAVVATAVLADCVRMVHIAYVMSQHPQVPWPNVQLNGTDIATLVHASADAKPMIRLDDQIPYGDFRHGRWAWMLDDIDALTAPIPATGHQGIWNWSQP